MKKFSHAWLAFMAIKRLEEATLSAADRKSADNLIKWFNDHKDDVIQGAWYPDAVIRDMANSHVLKHTPSDTAENKFKVLPKTYLNYQHCKASSLKGRSFAVDKHDNLPARCDALAHSIIDHLKMQECEEKGSPVSPTDNQIALLLFMLSHYIADAHVPFHCDSRRFSESANIHGRLESVWDDAIKKFYSVDKDNDRFFYDTKGYPMRKSGDGPAYNASILKATENALKTRKFMISWGRNNKNVWDFMSAVSQYSYLLSYAFIPAGKDHTNVTSANWKTLGAISLDDLSVAVLSDSIDSIARIWLRIWRRYLKWERKQRSKRGV
ncbi:hypothetical protein ACFL2A_03780 [Thermodesulfobacteriota bacterium]